MTFLAIFPRLPENVCAWKAGIIVRTVDPHVVVMTQFFGCCGLGSKRVKVPCLICVPREYVELEFLRHIMTSPRDLPHLMIM